MKNIILLVVMIAVAAYVYLVIRQNRESADQEYIEKPVIMKQREEKPVEQVPGIKYPVTEPQVEPVDIKPEPEPLPALDNSDEAIAGEISALSDKFQWQDLFLFKSIVRNFVVTVDNMTAKKLPRKYKILQSIPGKFLTGQKDEGSLFIDPDNYKRYETYVRLIETIDLQKLVAMYRRYYPLCQQAYEELGYPDRYFNDRLIEVIDHLLATPMMKGQILLKQPKVYYTFADPELEDLSAGQKLMLRMGADNANRVKQRLGKLRSLLTG